LLCVYDTMLHPIHLEQPEWHAAVDLDPKQVQVTRRRILKRAVAEKALMPAYHFPFPLWESQVDVALIRASLILSL
jgi:hypothetical protein